MYCTTQVIDLNELVLPLVQEGIEERVAQAKINAEMKAINTINSQLPEGGYMHYTDWSIIHTLQVVLN